jgi:autophagy-related protein 9
MSYPFATRYLDQFPKEMTARMARTVVFIAGALTTVLAIVTMVDTDLAFEITPDRSVLFYLTIFAGVWAFARGMVPEENTVFEPEYALRQVIEYTHYEPDRWQALGLHSSAVKDEFSALYKNKLVIFLEEIVGILIAPLILSVSLPRSSDQIVDFFREFTIHVDGLGYICSFAEFDFKKGVGKAKPDADTREDYYATKHGKMAASYYGFLDNYVINPRTGIPGHLPPGARNQFQPPPAFPSLQSPTLAADMAASRLGRSEVGRAGSRGPGGPSHTGRAQRHGMAAPATLSPMASILLDPHHQPPASTLGRSMHRTRRARHSGDIIEEGFEGEGNGAEGRRGDEDDAYESGHGLDESAWQASPAQTLGRDNSTANEGDREDGVFGMMYQFQRELQHRPGGMR